MTATDDLYKSIKPMFRSKAAHTCKSIAEETGAPMAQVRVALRQLIDEGVIEALGNTKARKYQRAA
ncbi:MAG: hypothetical protein IPH07_24560 [Deltaproteobacteria bacterium]|nr:hypothetical protein [Deltaproteobacteria bacterium]